MTTRQPPLFDHHPLSADALHELKRRAHAERAKAMREMLASLLAWRKRRTSERALQAPALKSVSCG